MGKTFLIHIDSFDLSSGGQVALHKLCHDIRSIGREAYVTCDHTHPKLNAPRLDKPVPIDELVVIYPEIVHGNPLGAKHVVRWLLNTPGKCGGVGSGFYQGKANSDLIYKYSPFFDYRGIPDGLLRSTFIDYDCFNNRQMTRDIGSCFLIKKGGVSEIIHPNDAMDFSPYQSHWELASDILNRSKFFFCYDNECFWVTLAALCGCIPIVIPNSDISFVKWLHSFPFNMLGVSFGLEMVNHAKETLTHVREHCESVQKNDLSGVLAMINTCDKL